MSGKVSRSCVQHMDGITFISQQQEQKYQWTIKPTVKLSAMELVQCTVYFAFKHSWSHGPRIKPNQTKILKILSVPQVIEQSLFLFSRAGKGMDGWRQPSRERRTYVLLHFKIYQRVVLTFLRQVGPALPVQKDRHIPHLFSEIALKSASRSINASSQYMVDRCCTSFGSIS